MPADDNQHVYEDASVIDGYRSMSTLTHAELRVFASMTPHLLSARFLDIGVGGGRTTEYLADKTASYVGIDYSAGLVAAARSDHPGVNFLECDARDMSMFDNASFDVVSFSFNGIDYVDHADRLRILGEVHRVLAPGGIFTFSSHNRDYTRRGLLPWQGRFRPGRVMLRKSSEALLARKNRQRLRGQQVEAADYAVVNDDAHGYSLLTYYIAPATQIQQLTSSGFIDTKVYDHDGTPAGQGSQASVWLHYTCRRS